MLSMIIFAAALAGAAAEPASQAQPPTAVPSSPTPPAKPKLVCKSETPLGARVPRKVCRPVGQATQQLLLDNIVAQPNPFPANN